MKQLFAFHVLLPVLCCSLGLSIGCSEERTAPAALLKPAAENNGQNPTSLDFVAPMPAPLTLNIPLKDPQRPFTAFYDPDSFHSAATVQIEGGDSASPTLIMPLARTVLWLVPTNDDDEAYSFCRRAQLAQDSISGPFAHKPTEILWSIPITGNGESIDLPFSDVRDEQGVHGGYMEFSPGDPNQPNTCAITTTLAAKHGLLRWSPQVNPQTLHMAFALLPASPELKFRFEIKEFKATQEENEQLFRDAENEEVQFSAFPCPGIAKYLIPLIEIIDANDKRDEDGNVIRMLKKDQKATIGRCLVESIPDSLESKTTG